MKILVINGPNLNLLGIREPTVYGHQTYEDLCQKITDYGKQKGHDITICQSNHEGQLVDWIQAAYQRYDGIVINPAAYTHTSIAILDALKAVNIVTVEVHLSDINKREHFRKKSYISEYCFQTVTGLGIDGYLVAIQHLESRINK